MIELVHGNIVEETVDALVSTADPGLFSGEGVDGAVHLAAGPDLMEACRKIGSCPAGQAVCTPSFDLANQGVKHIIHAVGPMWMGGSRNEEDVLAAAVGAALRLADEQGAETVALPAISTGGYGMPMEVAAPIIMNATKLAFENATKIERVRIVLHSEASLAIFVALL